MVDPETMCRKHLLGEHVETHMYHGSMRKRIALLGYLEGNLLEPASLAQRHDALAAEMVRRGYNHKSPMDGADASRAASAYLSNMEMATVVDVEMAKAELHLRCPACKELWDIKREGRTY